jgi:hypothetical protein
MKTNHPNKEHSPQNTYTKNPHPAQTCQCSRSSSGFHFFILFVLVGVGAFFWLNHEGFELVRSKTDLPNRVIESASSLTSYIMPQNAHKNGKTFENEINNQAPEELLEEDKEDIELSQTIVEEEVTEEILPDPATMLFGVVSRIRDSRNQP